MDIEPIEAILLVIFWGMMVSTIVIPLWNEFILDSKTTLYSIIPTRENLWIYLLILIVISPFFYKWFFRKLEKRKELKNMLEKEEFEIQRILNKNIKNYNPSEVKKFIESIDDKLQDLHKRSFHHKENLKEMMLKAERYLEELEHEDILSEIDVKKEEAEEKIKFLNEEIEKKKREIISEKSKILLSLNLEENSVYKKNSLNNKEIKILIEEGYSRHNEFCIYEQKRIPVLIKPRLNHSPNHTFLVWSAKRLLRKIAGIKYIQENLTKNADITFTYDGEEYALEIETGSLLGKHEQLKEKLNYLNRTYPDRWMFIVSHRDLYLKYKKLGLTSTRNNLLEKLEKLLKISHP